jgi:chorismate-pyruvate lyase
MFMGESIVDERTLSRVPLGKTLAAAQETLLRRNMKAAACAPAPDWLRVDKRYVRK